MTEGGEPNNLGSSSRYACLPYLIYSYKPFLRCDNRCRTDAEYWYSPSVKLFLGGLSWETDEGKHEYGIHDPLLSEKLFGLGRTATSRTLGLYGLFCHADKLRKYFEAYGAIEEVVSPSRLQQRSFHYAHDKPNLLGTFADKIHDKSLLPFV